MKEYVCKKDYYIEDVKFAQVGDHIMLLPDNHTVVNTNGNKVRYMPEIIGDTEYFAPTFETSRNCVITQSGEQEDMVNHPSHYTWLKDKCGIEVIDITRWLDFNIGNAIKYLLRAGHKPEQGLSEREKTIQDLEKAVWYINDRINQLRDGN